MEGIYQWYQYIINRDYSLKYLSLIFILKLKLKLNNN